MLTNLAASRISTSFRLYWRRILYKLYALNAISQLIGLRLFLEFGNFEQTFKWKRNSNMLWFSATICCSQFIRIKNPLCIKVPLQQSCYNFLYKWANVIESVGQFTELFQFGKVRSKYLIVEKNSNFILLHRAECMSSLLNLNGFSDQIYN